MKDIVITGCCVGRDIFNYIRDTKVKKFIQLNPVSCQTLGEGVTADLREVMCTSKFIRMCAETAFANKGTDLLIDNLAAEDFLIIDTAEERIPKAVIKKNDERVTIADHAFFKEFLSAVQKKGFEVEKLGFSAIPWEVVEENYKHFAEEILKTGIKEENIILLNIHMAAEFINENHRLVEFSETHGGFSQSYIKRANDYIHKCFLLLKTYFPKAKVINLPENTVAAYYARWGLNPLHYMSDTYEYLSACMQIQMGWQKTAPEVLEKEQYLKNELLINSLKLQSLLKSF